MAESGCTGPTRDPDVLCGRKVYAKGKCEGHYRQEYRGEELRPLREGNMVKVPGLPFGLPAETAQAIKSAARRHGISTTELVRDVLVKVFAPPKQG